MVVQDLLEIVTLHGDRGHLADHTDRRRTRRTVERRELADQRAGSASGEHHGRTLERDGGDDGLALDDRRTVPTRVALVHDRLTGREPDRRAPLGGGVQHPHSTAG